MKENLVDVLGLQPKPPLPRVMESPNPKKSHQWSLSAGSADNSPKISPKVQTLKFRRVLCAVRQGILGHFRLQTLV